MGILKTVISEFYSFLIDIIIICFANNISSEKLKQGEELGGGMARIRAWIWEEWLEAALLG